MGIVAMGILTSGFARTNRDSLQTIPIQTYLQLEPFPLPLPAFYNRPKGSFKLEDLLNFEPIPLSDLLPARDSLVTVAPHTQLRWEEKTFRNGFSGAGEGKSGLPVLTYSAIYLHASRWCKIKISVSSVHPFAVYLDGEKITSQGAVHRGKTPPDTLHHTAVLESGTHLLLVKSLRAPRSDSSAAVRCRLQAREKFAVALRADTSPKRTLDIHHLLEEPTITDVGISPDGRWVSLVITRTEPPEGKKTSRIEIRRFKDGKRFYTFREESRISHLRWAPVGHRFAFLVRKETKSNLQVVDLDEGSNILLLRDVEHLKDFTWSPTGDFLIYSIEYTPEEKEAKVRHVRSLRDRWPWWRKHSFLYRVNYPNGTRMRLTAGNRSTHLQGVSPDGTQLLFTRVKEDYSARPYAKTTLYLLDLTTLHVDSLWQGRWFEDALWSPDGKSLLLTGGPSMFGTLGVNVPDGRIPNEYDIQAYLYHLATGKVEALTREFAPSIRKAYWNQPEEIYFSTTDRSFRTLYRFQLKSRRFQRMQTIPEVINRVRFARKAARAVYTGSGTRSFLKAYTIDLKKNRSRLFLDPAKKDFALVQLGKVEEWNFLNERGDTIRGRVYYPPDFSPDKTYPCIVYYYGGTNPVGRDFGGRYPKQYWAAHGYVVYVLQPSGAVGFGQAFSSYHVNDWGKIVSGEILSGIRQFLAAHPFVDEMRVGGIGASYGGFMTMLLVTRSDLFAAAVSHAGISDITSYWGEGYWGFIYSAVASANSFPWNRKDIYVKQSPIYAADKIHTPLLLLHGSADTNVPPAESHQLFTALKILQRPVELVEIPGENHWIMDYPKRKIWTRTIMAWFDRWLKGEPEWWNHLYPQKK